MICGECKYTDGCVYTSMPAKLNCTITGEYHKFSDECNCESARLLMDKKEDFKKKVSEIRTVQIAVPDNADVTQVFEGGVTTATVNIDACEYGVPCLICGEEISVSWYQTGPKICDDCKQAILFIKEKFKGEY